MKFDCVKNTLEAAVGVVGKVAGKQMNLPVLACIKIEAQKNTLILSATNLDLAIEYRLPAKVSAEGVIAVPAAIVGNLLNGLSGEQSVTLETFQNNLRLISSHSSTVIKAVPHDDFPLIPKIQKNMSVKLAARDIIGGLSSIVHFASTSSVKAELASVLVYSEDNHLYFVATDSFRLGEKRVPLKNPPEIRALIPAKNIPEIIKAIQLVGESVEVTFSDHQVAFTCGDIYITSRLVEGSFPDYRQIIPKSKQTDVVMLKEDLAQAFKTLSVFSDKFNQLHMLVAPREKRFEISTKNSDVGESHYAPQATLTGEPVEVNFNIRYLLDCLPVIASDSVSLEFNGAGKALLVKGLGDPTFLYLVMPMNK